MIERTTLDGEPCIAAYLDDDFQPVDKADATLAKVFCGNRVIWLSMREEAEAEDEHLALDAAINDFFAHDAEGVDPVAKGWVGRSGETGKFTSKGSGGGAAAKPAKGGRARVQREDGHVERVQLPQAVMKAASKLPEAPERYFNIPDNAKMIPVEKLVLSRARPEGIVNAAGFMEQAYHGEKERRKPIDVRELPDGSYRVVDGNSTSTIATAAGWEQIPAMLVEGEGEAHPSPAVQAVRESELPPERLGRMRAWQRFVGYEKGLVARGTERVKSILNEWAKRSAVKGKSAEEAVQVAHEVQDHLSEVSQKIAATSRVKRSGEWSEKNNPDGLEGLIFIDPGAKANVERIKDKVQRYDGDMGRMADLARGTFLVTNPNQIGTITERLSKEYGVALEDWRHTPEGYFDQKAALRGPHGMIAEMQFMPPAMDAYKNRGELPDGRKVTPGHTLFEEWREEDTPPERKAELSQEMRRYYHIVARSLSPEWHPVLNELGINPSGSDRAIAADGWRSPPQWDFPRRRPWEDRVH